MSSTPQLGIARNRHLDDILNINVGGKRYTVGFIYRCKARKGGYLVTSSPPIMIVLVLEFWRFESKK